MVTLKIDGMTCEHCVKSVREALSAVPGVTGEVAVSLADGEARVEGQAAADTLMAAVREKGYEARLR